MSTYRDTYLPSLRVLSLSSLALLTLLPLSYSALFETTRQIALRRRRSQHLHALSSSSEAQAQALTQLYSPLIILGRFANPFPEWTSHDGLGHLSWLFWKLLYQPLTGRFLWNGGLAGDEEDKVAQSLQIERVDFERLFGIRATHALGLGSLKWAVDLAEGERDEKGIKGWPRGTSAVWGRRLRRSVEERSGRSAESSPERADAEADGGQLGESWAHVTKGTDTPATVGSSEGAVVVEPAVGEAQTQTLGDIAPVTVTVPVQVGEEMTFTWIGQSTCFLQLDGLNILTDPIFSHRTLDTIFAPARLRPPACALSHLLAIDVVLVSHSHVDHLDSHTVDWLGNHVEWIVPLGLGDWFRRKGIFRVRELTWWESMWVDVPQRGKEEEGQTTGKGRVEVIATPAMHWTARNLFDTNQSLWCSFVVRGSKDSFFHAGDTGCTQAFDAIGELYGPITLAAIPIGSYVPRWHLHSQHTDPEGAVRIHKSVRAKKSIGVHWGTYILSDERYDDPPKDLAIARQKLGVSEDEFSVVPIGRTLVSPSTSTSTS